MAIRSRKVEPAPLALMFSGHDGGKAAAKINKFRIVVDKGEADH